MEGKFCDQGLTIWGSANGNGNESAYSCLSRANDSQLVNSETMQVSERSRDRLIAGRCGIHVRVRGRGLVYNRYWYHVTKIRVQ